MSPQRLHSYTLHPEEVFVKSLYHLQVGKGIILNPKGLPMGGRHPGKLLQFLRQFDWNPLIHIQLKDPLPGCLLDAPVHLGRPVLVQGPTDNPYVGELTGDLQGTIAAPIIYDDNLIRS